MAILPLLSPETDKVVLQGSFETQLVQKREVILNGSEDLILSLYTKGMSVK